MEHFNISTHAHYVVFSFSEKGEALYEYIGNDLFDAMDIFNQIKYYLINDWLEDYNAGVIIKNNLNDVVIEEFNINNI